MKIKMLQDACGTANESGNATKIYKKDEHVECNSKWEQDLASVFVAEGQAMEIKTVEPTETKAKPKKKKAVKK
jgi:hypothetical protein|tara:strand:- start:390 stop:608 length:219 start_codon:yes stop_codon:yes gene_type:complete